MATIAVIGLLYLLKLVLITTLASVLLAFMLEPLVRGLAKAHIPRGGGSLVAVLLLLVVAGGLSYFFYNRAIDFAVQLPRYSRRDSFRAQHLALADPPDRREHARVYANRQAQAAPCGSSEERGTLQSVAGRVHQLPRNYSGPQLHPFSRVLHADLEDPRARGHRPPVSKENTAWRRTEPSVALLRHDPNSSWAT